MNNNKISNPKTEVPIGIEMNEKDYLTCLLGILKELENIEVQIVDKRKYGRATIIFLKIGIPRKG